MIADETMGGLARLSVEQKTTLPHSPYQNGKQERFWETLEGSLMDMLENVDPLTLQELNRATQAWVEIHYNRSTHSEIGCSPLEKAMKGKDVSRENPDSQAMREAFTKQVVRKLRYTDNTFTLDGVRFQLPTRFRNMTKLYLRYRRWDLSQVYLVDPRTASIIQPILPLDKIDNSDSIRKGIEPMDPQQSTPQPKYLTDPYPPALRRMLSHCCHRPATSIPAQG